MNMRHEDVGFSFDLSRRNDMLVKKGLKQPGYRKTGTTIVCLIYKSHRGTIVADKNCQKIHPIAPNIYCCGAGTAADTEAVTDNISSELKLDRHHTGQESRVVAALTLLKSHLYRYQGHVSAALILGGVDVTGPHLHTLYPYGSTDTLPFATMGSGSLAAMPILESEYRQGLTRDEGINLVTKAICSGIFNDLGSGSSYFHFYAFDRYQLIQHSLICFCMIGLKLPSLEFKHIISFFSD
ncbi:20S proteasome beta subunit PBB2 [Artemisia annua]|uniref:20S proteasome beta subunit PBB2 n=1 Tax=Artemisia annua TaxID=35608 RepID=A0A2U1L4Y4_ARTAN|nr:20S proteasome beta subunit PBB2 [Artemisia annua]